MGIQKPKKINVQGIGKYIIAITMFFSIGPFFVWNNFMGGMGYIIFHALEIVVIAFLCMLIKWRRVPSKKCFAGLSMIMLFLFLALFTGVRGGTYLPLVIGNIVVFLTFALLVMADEECLADSFNILKTIITIVLGYTLIIFILVIIGLPIPAVSMQSNEAGRTAVSGQSYINYLGCLFIRSPFIARMDRFTSVFTEPGVVGTTSAFFLAASDFDLKKDKRNIILLASGICSLSLAFIFLCAILLLTKAIRKKSYKIITGIAVFLVVYLIFTNVSFSNSDLASFQSRLLIFDSGFGISNRMTDYAEIQYESFLHSDIKTVLLGYGNAYVNPSTNVNFWQGSATYKRQIFQYGFLGFGYYCLWMVLAPYKAFKTGVKEIDGRMIAYIVVFLASIYQRPQLTSLFFIYFLIAGCVYVKYLDTIIDVSVHMNEDHVAEAEPAG